MTQALPQHGTAWPQIAARMDAMAARDVKWRDGKAAVYVFNAGPEVEQVQKDAYLRFMSENGLGPAAFPSLRDMEAQVVGYGLSLLHGPAGAVGNMTTGGTDSIQMAVKAARDYARKARGVTGPLNIVLPASAHPAFDKACAVMEIEVRRIPLADYLADPEAMTAAADAATMMIVGSAPCFPFGLIDPIARLGELAAAKGLWLHVDACVGGYMAPFVRMNGADIAPFDFEVPGVWSMSADLHKYGYCAKGASTVFFRSEDLRRYMIFDLDVWPAGRMVTPTLSGTRPGGAIASAWAVMNFLGVAGYRDKHAQAVGAREAIQAGVEAMGFSVIGRPQLGLLAFTRDDVDCHVLARRMFDRGWVTSAITKPKGLHLMLSPIHAGVVEQYLGDLGAVLAETRAGATASPVVGYGA